MKLQEHSPILYLTEGICFTTSLIESSFFSSLQGFDPFCLCQTIWLLIEPNGYWSKKSNTKCSFWFEPVSESFTFSSTKICSSFSKIIISSMMIGTLS